MPQRGGGNRRRSNSYAGGRPRRCAGHGFHFERFGIFVREPRRHDGGGRADNDFHAVLFGELEPAIEPLELVLSFFRLEQNPGKLGDSDDVEAGVLHHLEVGFPALLRPMFGTVIGADVDTGVFWKEVILFGGPMGADVVANAARVKSAAFRIVW